MYTCAVCGFPDPYDWVFCPFCGSKDSMESDEREDDEITHEDIEECGVAGLNAARREREDD